MFFGLFSNKISLADSNLFKGFTDWHCHLLPGVDDGVKTMEESLQILSLYEQLGVSDVWCTPHIMEDIPNTSASLKNRFDQLQSVYIGNICLHLGAEYMLDNLFLERLYADDLLPIGDDECHLLVETSYFSPPIDLYHTLSQIQARGYYPILAHPERYVYMTDSDYNELKKIGVKLQLNLPSLAGMYGKEAKSKAEKLIKKGFYDFRGTDTHKLSQFEYLTHTKKIKALLLTELSLKQNI